MVAELFRRQYLLEYEPLFSLERDRHEVARLLDVLGLPSGARVLDVPCGQGRHAHLLAEAGCDVDGLDYSRELLKRARERGTGPRLRYTRGDMRALPARWTSRFSAVLNLFTSFGFLSSRRTIDVLAEFARARAGRSALHGAPDGVTARFLARRWQTNDGTRSDTSEVLIRCRASSRSTRRGRARTAPAIGSMPFDSTRRHDSPSSVSMSA